MKKLYFIFSITVILIVTLLVLSFVFFEKEKHRKFFYNVSEKGEKIGSVRVDYYRTEDSVIYKATVFNPKNIKNKIIHERIIFGRNDSELKSFISEAKDFGAISRATYMKGSDRTIDFLFKEGSKFSALSSIQHPKGVSVFNKNSFLSYIPFIDKYQFGIGGAQSFNMLYWSDTSLPPSVGKLIMRLVGEEYITVGEKRIKSFHLVFKAKNLPGVHVWTSKENKNVVRLELRDKGRTFEITKSLEKSIYPEYKTSSEKYVSNEILFSSGDIALSGTLDIPKKEGKLPGVLLIVGDGGYNRENAGAYTYISDYLAKEGVVVLRFDKRGIGKSQGNNASVSVSDEIKDIENALRYLSDNEKVDTEKIFLFGHAQACRYITKVKPSKFPLAGMVMLSMAKTSLIMDMEAENTTTIVKELTDININYPSLLSSIKKETTQIVSDSKVDYAFKFGRRIFIKKMRELNEVKPYNDIENISVPALLVYGKKDKFVSDSFIKGTEEIFKKNFPDKRYVLMFRTLGHFLGSIEDRKEFSRYYSVDNEVLETVRGWMRSVIDRPKEPEVMASSAGVSETSPNNNPAELTNA